VIGDLVFPDVEGLSHDQEQHFAVAVLAFSEGIVPETIMYECYNLYYNNLGIVRRDALSDKAGIVVSLRAVPGATAAQVEAERKRVINFVYLGKFVPPGYPKAQAFRLPTTSTTSTTTATATSTITQTTTTTTKRVMGKATKNQKAGTTSIIIGIALLGMLLIAFAVGIGYHATHKRVGDTTGAQIDKVAQSAYLGGKTRAPGSATYASPSYMGSAGGYHANSISYGFGGGGGFPGNDQYITMGGPPQPEYRVAQSPYGIPQGRPDNAALSQLLGSMWGRDSNQFGDSNGRGIGNGPMAPAMMPDPLNSRYSTHYSMNNQSALSTAAQQSPPQDNYMSINAGTTTGEWGETLQGLASTQSDYSTKPVEYLSLEESPMPQTPIRPQVTSSFDPIAIDDMGPSLMTTNGFSQPPTHFYPSAFGNQESVVVAVQPL
jgi:hypothetical protein